MKALKAHRSVSLAAEHLGISQSALSQRLARMEDALGMPLVIRGKVHLKLTGAGELLASYGCKLDSLRRVQIAELDLFLHSRDCLEWTVNSEPDAGTVCRSA